MRCSQGYRVVVKPWTPGGTTSEGVDLMNTVPMHNQWHWQPLRSKISPSPRRQDTHLSSTILFQTGPKPSGWDWRVPSFVLHLTRTNPDDVTDFQGESNSIMIHPIIPNQSVSIILPVWILSMCSPKTHIF